MDAATNLLHNGDDLKPQDETHKAIVKSSDGKLHDVTFNATTKKLNFALVE
jgi:hypothetical protein